MEEVMKYNFKVKGIDCANCAAELERDIQKISGVQSASINFMSEKMVIECEESEKEEIVKKIQKTIKKDEPDATMEEV
jgi:cation transport ATPase